MSVMRVLSGRRVTLPKEFLSKSNIKVGDVVWVEYSEGIVKVAPVEVKKVE